MSRGECEDGESEDGLVEGPAGDFDFEVALQVSDVGLDSRVCMQLVRTSGSSIYIYFFGNSMGQLGR